MFLVVLRYATSEATTSEATTSEATTSEATEATKAMPCEQPFQSSYNTTVLPIHLLSVCVKE